MDTRDEKEDPMKRLFNWCVPDAALHKGWAESLTLIGYLALTQMEDAARDMRAYLQKPLWA